MVEPIRITRREMLKCVLAAPLGVALMKSSTPCAVAQLGDEFSPPDYEVVLLWEGRALADNTGRDIRGNSAKAFASISHATNYSQLVWTGYKTGGVPLQFRILARSVDQGGMPLGAGWFSVGQGVVNTPPRRWFRVLISEGYWDEYRIELRTASRQMVYSRVLARWDCFP